MRTARPTLLLVAIALLASSPADARRFGGGRAVGMQRTVSTPHATVDVPGSHSAPTVTYSRAVSEPRYGTSDLLGDIARTSLRSRYLEEQRHREAEILERRRAERAARNGGNIPPDEAGPPPYAIQPHPGHDSTESPPPPPVNRPPRPADPNFTRLTNLQTATEPSCEFKPVMADRDYVACGITPPRFPDGPR